MNINNLFLYSLSNDPKVATKSVTEFLFKKIFPLMRSIRIKLQKYTGPLEDADISKVQDMYALCTCQIKKSFLTLIDVLKTEYHEQTSLQDSRQWSIERLMWCINRLTCIEQKLEKTVSLNQDETIIDFMLFTPMNFINWIDHTFEILSILGKILYRTDYKGNENHDEKWKNDVIEYVRTLHFSLDELMLSAMSLCKYCLPSDQHTMKARCQAVLRESKALLSELINGDLDTGFKVTLDTLKLPIVPSNVTILIDKLMDVLNVLETNTNAALLALVIHCFSYNISPVEVLKQHFKDMNGTCFCHVSDGEVNEDCCFVKEFDLYNERLLEIGHFAASCSSNQGRILCLRSGLASLEALDPHLVPAVMLSPSSVHAQLLADCWSQELQEIRDSIFLIVDPAAFAKKTKQMMRQILLELKGGASYNNRAVCSVIGMGCVVVQFFSAYNKLEPSALARQERLMPLLEDLNKVQMECKVVSNLLCSGDDYVFDVKTSKNKEVTVEQLMKRLKLLYTLVSRINSLLHSKENDELLDSEGEEVPIKNATTTDRKNIITYLRSPRKPANISGSIFVRTINKRKSANEILLQKFAQYLRAKERDELSFSIKLDDSFDMSEVKHPSEKLFVNKQFDSIREPSILYNFSPKKRGSLRKAVLNRHRKLPFETDLRNTDGGKVENRPSSDDSLIDEATSLQITDILNEMDDITNVFSEMRCRPDAKFTESTQEINRSTRINIGSDNNAAVFKHERNISVNASMTDSTATTPNVTEGTSLSNVDTKERINDIEFLETKLNRLKTYKKETT